MTTDERFERIEHVTAGLVEERRKDREEYRQLWRDTQNRINELTAKIAEVDERLARSLEEFARESRAADDRLRQQIESVDKHLRDRIDSLVSAIGTLVTSMTRPNA